jgi:hypothetical protein
VPKLYAAFVVAEPFLERRLGSSKKYVIIMEYLEGRSIDYKSWGALDDWSQETICSRLSEQLQLLRSVPQGPQTYYGRVHHQSLSWHFLLVKLRSREMRGPYDTHKDFVSAMYDNVTLREAECVQDGSYTKEALEWLSEFKPVLLQSKNSRPVRT